MPLFKKAASKVKIGNKYVGEGYPTFIIAEIGNNHNGDFYLAKRSIEAAAAAGVDAVKFQKRFVKETFAKELLEKPQTKDQIFGKTYGEYREHLELSEDDFRKLKEYSDSLGLIFFATPFDHSSADFLERVGVDLYKIASFDATNIPLLEYVAKKGKPIILSVGMADQAEVDEAVEAILKHNNDLVILHCVSIYPTPDEKLNLKMIQELKKRYAPVPVGYSGHESDILPTLTAISLGATCIERHFTLDKALPGPDHAMSLTQEEVRRLVEGARRIEKGLGKAEKIIWEEEMKVRQKHGKSLVSKTDIPKGAVITADKIICKSPGYGIKPNQLKKIIGKRAAIDIPADTVVLPEHVSNLNRKHENRRKKLVRSRR